MKKQDYLKQNNFCVLLTASIDTNSCVTTKRSNTQEREQDYIGSLKLWLSKTDLPIVFCENSGYDLKNIRLLICEYPGRVEIIQFNGNNYPRHMGKSYGELKIIEKALEESYFISQSDNIIKVTGRVYINNIDKILTSFKNDTFIQYEWFGVWCNVQSIIFIFKKPFFSYLKKFSNEITESDGGFFEKGLDLAINMARENKYKCCKMKTPYYIGYSGTSDIKYNEYLISRKRSSKIKFIYRRILGKSRIFLKKYLPSFPNK